MFLAKSSHGTGANILVRAKRKSRLRLQKSAIIRKPYRKSFVSAEIEHDDARATFHSPCESLSCIDIAGSTARDSRTPETDRHIHLWKRALDYGDCRNVFCLCGQPVCSGEDFQGYKTKIVGAALVRDVVEMVFVSTRESP